jgi:hypothetical protein
MWINVTNLLHYIRKKKKTIKTHWRWSNTAVLRRCPYFLKKHAVRNQAPIRNMVTLPYYVPATSACSNRAMHCHVIMNLMCTEVSLWTLPYSCRLRVAVWTYQVSRFLLKRSVIKRPLLPSSEGCSNGPKLRVFSSSFVPCHHLTQQ